MNIDKARKKLGVKSIVTGESLEEIRRVVDYCRRSADSEAQRVFGAVRWMNEGAQLLKKFGWHDMSSSVGGIWRTLWKADC